MTNTNDVIVVKPTNLWMKLIKKLSCHYWIYDMATDIDNPCSVHWLVEDVIGALNKFRQSWNLYARTMAKLARQIESQERLYINLVHALLFALF